MNDLAIDLEWWRDAEGYRLVDAVPPKESRPDMGVLYAGGSGEPQRVVRLGGILLPYRPLGDFNGLFLEFARSAHNPNGVLGFIERFGPLTEAGLDTGRGEDVPLLIEHAEAMHGWLDACRNDNRAALPRMIGEGIKLGRVNAALTVDPITQRPRLRFTMDSLLLALWLQLGKALSKGAVVQQCLHCGTPFETGPGTPRRLDAKFCSDEHRIAFNSLKRSKVKDHA